uniref:Uncharacterized protein n=1 Tax=Mycena chlorophos TaxID=658473 RepID=A0ABQ0M3W7_MYCCL|nr:predicted protein [Mycena chlorophos]
MSSTASHRKHSNSKRTASRSYSRTVLNNESVLVTLGDCDSSCECKRCTASPTLAALVFVRAAFSRVQDHIRGKCLLNELLSGKAHKEILDFCEDNPIAPVPNDSFVVEHIVKAYPFHALRIRDRTATSSQLVQSVVESLSSSSIGEYHHVAAVLSNPDHTVAAAVLRIRTAVEFITDMFIVFSMNSRTLLASRSTEDVAGWLEDALAPSEESNEYAVHLLVRVVAEQEDTETFNERCPGYWASRVGSWT